MSAVDLARLCCLALRTLRRAQWLHAYARTRATAGFEAIARQQLASAEVALRYA